jgi:hypothetical protein
MEFVVSQFFYRTRCVKDLDLAKNKIKIKINKIKKNIYLGTILHTQWCQSVNSRMK